MQQAAGREDPLLVRRDAHVDAPLVDAAEKAAADGRQHDAHAAGLADLGLDGPHDLVHRGQARPLRRGDVDLELRLVDVARDVLLAHQQVERHRRGHHGQRDQATRRRCAMDQASSREYFASSRA